MKTLLQSKNLITALMASGFILLDVLLSQGISL